MHTQPHDACDEYITELIAHIHNLQDEIDTLRKENASYKLWMERSIQRVQSMQN